MTEPNIDHFNALVLALRRDSNHNYTTWYEPREIFKRHLRFHYPYPRSRRGGFEVYPGTRQQQQFDFDFVYNCEIEGWHANFRYSEQRCTKWNNRAKRLIGMDIFMARAGTARGVALKRTLELKYGVETLQNM